MPTHPVAGGSAWTNSCVTMGDRRRPGEGSRLRGRCRSCVFPVHVAVWWKKPAKTAYGHRTEHRLVRAQVVLHAERRRPHACVARDPGLHSDTVRRRRGRFAQTGLAGLKTANAASVPLRAHRYRTPMSRRWPAGCLRGARPPAHVSQAGIGNRVWIRAHSSSQVSTGWQRLQSSQQCVLAELLAVYRDISSFRVSGGPPGASLESVKLSARARVAPSGRGANGPCGRGCGRLARGRSRRSAARSHGGLDSVERHTAPQHAGRPF